MVPGRQRGATAIDGFHGLPGDGIEGAAAGLALMNHEILMFSGTKSRFFKSTKSGKLDHFWPVRIVDIHQIISGKPLEFEFSLNWLQICRVVNPTRWFQKYHNSSRLWAILSQNYIIFCLCLVLLIGCGISPNPLSRKPFSWYQDGMAFPIFPDLSVGVWFRTHGMLWATCCLSSYH